MRKNGFTLIELLAVIVILAIIALIATPIILGIINDAREKANERSVELYASAVRNAIAAYQLTGLNTPDSFSDLTIQYDGDVKCSVQELYEDGSFYLAGCKVNKSTKEYSYGTQVGYTGTIYRNSTENLLIGNYINTDNRWCAEFPGFVNTCVYNGYDDEPLNTKAECETTLEKYAELAKAGELDETIVENAICEQGTLTYETNLSNISQNHYLKHDVVNNEVTASYACITYTENGIKKEVCLKGGDSSYYKSNQTILHSIESYFNTLSYSGGNGNCEFSDFDSSCISDSLYLYADNSGQFTVSDNTLFCSVFANGNSDCHEV